MDTKQSCNTELYELRKTHQMYIRQQVALLNAMKEIFGDDVIPLAQDTFCKETFKPYIPVIKQVQKRTIENLVKILWEPLKHMGFNFKSEKIPNGIQITCTRCPWVMLYKEAKGENWGYELVCKADIEFVKLYNPEIKFERTQTLMQGHTYCNHKYTIK